MLLLLESDGLEECACGPGLPHSACSADQLEHFVHVEPLGQFVSEDDVGDGEVGAVAERLVTDDECEEVGRG
jgi:hypothetical protein